jgi:class 3 adenylate cyclase/tetratricopeptide (TPR) repeat protein
VTLLFCDMVGSTASGEALDAESVRGLMFRYFHEMRSAIERHGGTVEKFIGDAVVAVFGAPVAHEDDALRAVRAAAEMRAELDVLNEELERLYGTRIGIRIGVNTGEVVTGDFAGREVVATGDAVNVAARLEQTAAPGEILLGEQTYRLVREAITADDLEPLELKGKAAPVPAYRLREIAAGGLRPMRRAPARFVGRDSELDALYDHYRAVASQGGCRLVTVVGEAGAGKSRLAEELTSRVAGEASVLWGRALSYGEGITYWPVAEALRDAAGVHDEDSPDDALEKLRALAGEGRATSPVADVLGQALGFTSGAATSDEIGWAIRSSLETIARARPLLLVFDDVHWGRAAFLDLVGLLSTATAPILVLCLARPELLEQRAEWEVTISLDPLAEEATAQLVRHLAGDRIEVVERRIAEAAQGNPLFVEQLLAMLVEDGMLRRRRDGSWVVAGDLERLRLPVSLSVLLTARLDRLREAERAVAERGAIEGRTFHRGAVAALSAAGEQDGVSRSIEELAAKQLVEPAAARFVDEAAFRFRHILIREAAYAGISKRLRAELHERFADWLRAKAADRALEYAEIVGYHLEQAFRYRKELGPVDEAGLAIGRRASELLGSAGRSAFTRGDMTTAANLLDRALEVGEGGAELRYMLGAAHVEVGRFEDGTAALTAAAEGAAAAGDRATEARALLELAWVRMMADPEAGYGQLLRTSEQAIRVGEELGDALVLARAFHVLGVFYFGRQLHGRAVEALERALVYARRAGARREEGDILYFLVLSTFWGPISSHEAIPRWEALLSRSLGRPVLEASARTGLAMQYTLQARFDEARRLLAQAVEVFGELGMTFRVAGNDYGAAELELLAGDPAAAEAAVRPGYTRFLAAGDRNFAAGGAGLLARAAYAQGRYDEAARFSDRERELAGDDDIDAGVNWRVIRAKVAARRGEFEDALRLLDKADSLLATTDALVRQADALLARAEILRLAGRLNQAAAAAERALTLAEQKGHLPAAAHAHAVVQALTA